MTNIMSQAWKIVKPHVPLIKFRKGGPESSLKSQVSSENSATLAKKVQDSTHIPRKPLIEDWQLPLKYKRHLLDEKEINAINSGGAY